MVNVCVSEDAQSARKLSGYCVIKHYRSTCTGRSAGRATVAAPAHLTSPRSGISEPYQTPQCNQFMQITDGMGLDTNKLAIKNDDARIYKCHGDMKYNPLQAYARNKYVLFYLYGDVIDVIIRTADTSLPLRHTEKLLIDG